MGLDRLVSGVNPCLLICDSRVKSVEVVNGLTCSVSGCGLNTHVALSVLYMYIYYFRVPILNMPPSKAFLCTLCAKFPH